MENESGCEAVKRILLAVCVAMLVAPAQAAEQAAKKAGVEQLRRECKWYAHVAHDRFVYLANGGQDGHGSDTAGKFPGFPAYRVDQAMVPLMAEIGSNARSESAAYNEGLQVCLVRRGAD